MQCTNPKWQPKTSIDLNAKKLQPRFCNPKGFRITLFWKPWSWTLSPFFFLDWTEDFIVCKSYKQIFLGLNPTKRKLPSIKKFRSIYEYWVYIMLRVIWLCRYCFVVIKKLKHVWRTTDSAPGTPSHPPTTLGTIKYPWEIRVVKDKRDRPVNTFNICGPYCGVKNKKHSSVLDCSGQFNLNLLQLTTNLKSLYFH